MPNLYLQIALSLIVACIVCLILIPGIIRISLRLKLVDIPNARKVHSVPIPRMGGIAIFTGTCAGLLLSRTGLAAITGWPILFSSLCVLFAVGVWDDLKDISPRLRLVIQLGCAVAVASTGIRLTSLYGILGFHALSPVGQYVITVVIIAGATNAFNLIDGIDGLAGGLAFIGLLVLAGLAYTLQLFPLVVVIVALAGAVAAFLWFNHSPARIFMGDAGSIFLGYFMSAVGILLVERAHAQPQLIMPGRAALLICAILVIPVFDSLRVFAYRIRKGRSPFKADKTHIHHLLLLAGMDHRRTAWFLYGFELLLILLAWTLSGYTGVSIIIAAMVVLFHILTKILWINQDVERWMIVIKKMERDQK